MGKAVTAYFILICFAGLSAFASAGILGQYDADAGTPIESPVSQGWTESGSGTNVTLEGINLNGTNAWRILDNAANLNPAYYTELSPADLQMMYISGWEFTMTVRPGPDASFAGFGAWGVSVANDPGWGLTSQERVGFTIQTASGNAFQVSPVHGGTITLESDSANEFHSIRCVGQPLSSQYEFFVDGQSQGVFDIKDGGSNTNYDNAVRFASGSTGGTGIEAYWHSISLTAFGINVIQSDGDTSVDEEAATTDTYTIQLLEPPTDTVTVSVTPDEAGDGSGADIDLGAGPGVPVLLQWQPGNWTDVQTVTVQAVDDTFIEGPHQVMITHHATSSDPRFDGITILPVLVTVADNESWCVNPQLNYLPGDLSGDCRVGLADLLAFGANWLDMACLLPSCGNLDGMVGVELSDLSIIASNWLADSRSLVISEFMASNDSAFLDGDGLPSDWIEIYNESDETISLENWYLTDNDSNLTKWRFPAGYSIEAGKHLIVFASGKTQPSYPENYPYVDSSGYLHTNFSLAADGDYLALVKPDGTTVTSEYDAGGKDFPEQVVDVSYGVDFSSSEIVYFAQPTPGTLNGPGVAGFVDEPKLSVQHGFYENPFSVTITTDTEGTAIYYTTDGSAPDETAGVPYTGPISVTTTTVVRAIAVKPDYGDSKVATQSYLFLQDVLAQTGAGLPVDYRWDYQMDPEIVNDPRYSSSLIDDLKSIPTVSLALSADDMWGPSGIFANPTSRGAYWEREASIELILADGSKGFQEDGGLRIHGGGSRNKTYGKKSLRFAFRNEYGAAKLKYPFFGKDAVDTINNIVLRGNYFDTWSYCCYRSGDYIGYNNALYCRDNYARVMHQDMGWPALKGYFVHVYVNGIYWGVHDATERPDEHYCADYFGGQPEDYDIIKHKVELVSGNREAWDELMILIDGDMSTHQLYAQVCERVDIDDFIDYVLLNIWGGNKDWPHNNWYVYRNRAQNGPFRFIEWDAESFLFELGTNRTGVNSGNSPGELYSKLRQNEEFRLRFADHVHRHMFNGGALTVEACLERFIAITDALRPALNPEAARWGDTRDYWEGSTNPPLNTIDTWDPVVTKKIDSYIPQRSPLVLDQLRAAHLYPATEAPIFNVNGTYQHGGYIDANDLIEMTLTGSGGGTYVEAELVAEGALVYAHVPTDNSLGQTWTTVDFTPTADWTDGTTGTGVGYDTGSDYDNWIDTDVQSIMRNHSKSVLCRIEFDYDSSLGVETLQLSMKYDDGFVAYLNGTEICRSSTVTNDVPGSAAAGNHEASATPEVFDVTAHVGLLLDGENVLAIHGINASLTSSDMIVLPRLTGEYPDTQTGPTPIWYTVNGEDPRLPGGAINPNAVNYTEGLTLNAAAHLKARTLQGGVWSALNEATFAVGPVAGSLRITELMYHPADPNTEFVEFKNVGTETINLSLVQMTNGVDFTFPSMDLLPGQYTLAVQNIPAFTAKYGTGHSIAGQYTGQLENGGEKVEMQDAFGSIIHQFDYKDGWFDITDGEGFSLTIKDPAATDPNLWDDKSGWRPSAMPGGSPGADDAGDIPAIGAVVINELLAHSDTHPDDWIELHNTTDTPVNIGGWFLSDDNDTEQERKKYQIPEGTFIEPNDFIVFYESQSFNNPSAPGCNIPFQLSENGETVYLQSGSGGVLTGYYETERFGPSDKDIAFGRHQKSTGTFNFVAMSTNTPAATNAYPKVGPLVISEIMYHPQNNADAEYVELKNISASNVTLYDFTTNEPWRFVDDADDPGVEFYFSATPVTVNAGQTILLIKHEAAFKAEFGNDSLDGITWFEWTDGSLSNGSEKPELQMPGDVDMQGNRKYIRIDRVSYDDELPWPANADGQGQSLTKPADKLNQYGNDPIDWQAATPSPGL